MLPFISWLVGYYCTCIIFNLFLISFSVIQKIYKKIKCLRILHNFLFVGVAKKKLFSEEENLFEFIILGFELSSWKTKNYQNLNQIHNLQIEKFFNKKFTTCMQLILVKSLIKKCNLKIVIHLMHSLLNFLFVYRKQQHSTRTIV